MVSAPDMIAPVRFLTKRDGLLAERSFGSGRTAARRAACSADRSRASTPKFVRAAAVCVQVADHAAPVAEEGTANWSLAGVSAVRVAFTALKVEAKLLACA